MPANSGSAAEADLLLGLHGPYAIHSTERVSNERNAFDDSLQGRQPTAGPPQQAFDYPLSVSNQPTVPGQGLHPTTPGGGIAPSFNEMMMIESQDIDMSTPQGGFAFPGGEMIPWLEYLPQDILSYFGDPPDDGSIINQAGPGPAQPPLSQPPHCG
jgi:hypothetical protein